ncbi:hypothetical protein J3L11_18735, partial [Shewanella sp. 4t3-1-2LB]|uniref:hypothetical protein n=1 Tax=Shewanella sp. 4t3-1-2LB TaxID=2817682 RepID=UPI001A992508
ESEPALYEYSKGVWLDNFKDNILDILALDKFLNDGKSVVLVSPELHKMEQMQYWQDLKEYISQHEKYAANIGICTDYPEKARSYFNE